MFKQNDLIRNVSWPEHQHAKVIQHFPNSGALMVKLSNHLDGGYGDGIIVNFNDPSAWVKLNKKTMKEEIKGK